MTKHAPCLTVLASVFWAAPSNWAGEAADGPVFQFHLGGGLAPPPAEAGTPFRQEVFCSLATSSNPDPERGAEAYSVSLAADGITITGITVAETASAKVDDNPPGLRNGGFEQSELSSGGAGECAGLSGAVSTVVLSTSLPITLPAEGSELIARLTVEGSYPQKGETLHGSIRFVDGCQGSGDPVLNRVQYAGSKLEPLADPYAIELKAMPDCPSADAPIQTIIQTRSTGQTHELFAGMAPTPDPSVPAEIVVPPGRVTVYAAIVSNLPPGGPGLQAWSFSMGMSGEATLVSATTDNTVAAPVSAHPPGLFNGGLGRTQTVDPTIGAEGPQGQGAVSSIVLSFVEPVTLRPVGTATVLSLTLEGKDGQGGQLFWKDGLQGSAQPVRNYVVIEGQDRNFDCFQRANVRFQAPVNPFHRGDANDDGTMDISDPIRILGFLFLGAAQPPCMDAADFNDDARLDLSDAVGILLLKFNGGSPPPPPGPPSEPCGLDPAPHLQAGCAEYTHC